jgi:DNA topoisomerase-1
MTKDKLTVGTSTVDFPSKTTPPPDDSARQAGLRYVSDNGPGIRRVRAGKGFQYQDSQGKRVRDRETLARIRSLVIPPAWTDVWICPIPLGHLQATGRDARGRKQYRYHPRWRSVRDANKYHRVLAFGKSLCAIRARVDADLSRPGLPREKVLATVVRLLERSLIRVGNGEYVKQNGSYGLTTLRNRHVRVAGETLHFAFRGKSGIRHCIDVHDRRLARVVRRLQELPGQELFQYEEADGARRSLDSADVNEYLRTISGQDFTAKDFRTWAGTVLMVCALREFATFQSQSQAKKNLVGAIKTVAERLGNTVAVCRKCYVHPAVLDSYLEGSLFAGLQRRNRSKWLNGSGELPAEERLLLRFLHRRLKASATTTKAG